MTYQLQTKEEMRRIAVVTLQIADSRGRGLANGVLVKLWANPRRAINGSYLQKARWKRQWIKLTRTRDAGELQAKEEEGSCKRPFADTSAQPV
jgi:hypothetical protein